MGELWGHDRCMIDFTIQIAGRTVAVTAQFESTRGFCAQYLCGEKADFSVKIEREDLLYEREKQLREDALENRPPLRYSDEQLEVTALLRKITEELFAFDTLLFHGSVVAVDGKAYLFTAKSGTGKSTHTRLWCSALGERAVIVNDDKPFLRFTQDGILACGTPWNGKHRRGANISVPLEAICILERGETNHIRAIQAKDAVFMLLQQSSRPLHGKTLPKYMELVDRLAGSVKFYQLACNMEPEAALLSYETMSAGRKDVFHED